MARMPHTMMPLPGRHISGDLDSQQEQDREADSCDCCAGKGTTPKGRVLPGGIQSHPLKPRAPTRCHPLTGWGVGGSVSQALYPWIPRQTGHREYLTCSLLLLGAQVRSGGKAPAPYRKTTACPGWTWACHPPAFPMRSGIPPSNIREVTASAGGITRWPLLSGGGSCQEAQWRGLWVDPKADT